MKKYKRIIILGGLLFCFLSQLQAQSAAMQAQRQTAQFQQFAMQSARLFHQQSQMFQNMYIMRNNMRGNLPSAGGKYKFSVVTLNGDTIKAKKNVKISFYEPIKTLELKTDLGMETIKPKETKEIFVKKGKHVLTGIPYTVYNKTKKAESDSIQTEAKQKTENPIKELQIKTGLEETSFGSKSTLEFLKDKQTQDKTIREVYWIFKTYSIDNINFYSPFPEYDVAYLLLYQIGDDSIKSITPEVITELVKGNEKAEKALRKKKPGKALDIFIKAEMKKRK